MPRVRLKRVAEEQLAALSDARKSEVDDALLLLIADAHAGDQLRGNLRGKWRLKTGRIRILYRILEDGGLVIVDGIVYRDQAYPPRGH